MQRFRQQFLHEKIMRIGALILKYYTFLVFAARAIFMYANATPLITFSLKFKEFVHRNLTKLVCGGFLHARNSRNYFIAEMK